ncbi:TonB-dependent receptor plug domain-containing protein [Sphingomonas sp. CFBP 8760]|uniref:TonB-dependent receptor plug domain-containing protein n=1 Tax=Sphingomonas sp. CFBP 8760 TaxID=2775282 RepID=UPI00178769D4|nr:TonB-dependent receptor plug domain-containing protein [Sphingomonas sp. CFBP 8760]MBD8548637.1 TonB-dependent receptor [Sphingomonas sp. CFBP 8760]
MRRFFSLMAATAAGTMMPAGHLDAQIVDYATLSDAFGEPITTSVTGKPQRASEAPAAITIITHDEIARSPARSVPDLLKAYTGIDVNRWTAGQSDVTVRGGVQTYSARLLVLVDGRQVYLDHYGMTNWNLLGVQLDEIQQIELVRGPASALFGFNAASGVVNIITTGADAERHVSGTAEIGTHGYARVGGSVTVPVSSTIGLKISGGHQREDERAIPGAFYQPPRTRHVYADQVRASLAIQADASTSITLDGGLTGNRQLEFLPSQILTEQRFRNQTAGLLVNRDTDWGSLTGRIYTNWLQADYGITTPATDPYSSVADLRTNNRITVMSGSGLIGLGAANTLRLGAEYRDNHLRSGSLFSDRIGYQVAALSGMIDLHPTERVAITGALRLDHLWLDQSGTPAAPQIDPVSAYQRSITPISFNAAVTAQVSDNDRLRINGGRGLQLPSLISLGVRVMVPAPDVPIPVYLTGDPRLAPVIVWSAETSYSHGFGSDIHFDATLFYTRTENLVASPGGSVDVTVVLTPAPIAVTRFANVGSFESYGVELAASGKLSRNLNWLLDYSLAKIDDNIPANRDVTFYALFPERATPRHRANLSVDYTVGDWSAAALAHLTSASYQSSFLPSTELTMIRVPATVTVDGKITKRIGSNIAVYAAGENLTKAQGAYGSPIPADRRLRLGITTKL